MAIKCYIVSWNEAYRLARMLAHKIIDSGFKPDIVIGIARGGLIPGRIVCDFLFQKDLITIRTEHWGVASNQGKARIKYSLPVEVDISGKRLLVVDDVADTGDSFSVIKDYLEGKNPLEIRTAVLQYKTSSTFIPDYWGEKLEEWNWIIYPWAFYEDVDEFVQKLLSRPATNEELMMGLKNNFNITMSKKDLLEILNDMHKLGKLNKSKKNNKILWEKVKPKSIEQMNIRVHVFVSGKVQGVFFRSGTKDMAENLGLSGWVRNLADGRVEAVFEGNQEAVEKMVEWCRKGPEYARVAGVEVIMEDYKGEFNGFLLRR